MFCMKKRKLTPTYFSISSSFLREGEYIKNMQNGESRRMSDVYVKKNMQKTCFWHAGNMQESFQNVQRRADSKVKLSGEPPLVMDQASGSGPREAQ